MELSGHWAVRIVHTIALIDKMEIWYAVLCDQLAQLAQVSLNVELIKEVREPISWI